MIRLIRISYHMSKVVPFEKFEEVFEPLVANETKAIVLFTSEKNNDGTYWCPDCEAIKPLYPAIEQQAKKANLPLFIFVAGDRPTWKNPDNKLRKHKLIQLKSVPTLGLFDGKKVTNKLVQSEIMDGSQRAMIYG